MIISTTFKIEITEEQVLSTASHISYLLWVKITISGTNCVDLIEYNNFSFGNKEMNFKIQILFEAEPDSHFRKLVSRLD